MGSYNKNNLCTVLSTVWTASSLSSGNGYTYVVTYSSASVGDTFKLTFTVSGNSGVQSRVSFNTNSPFRQLGFLVDSEDSNKTFASNALVNTNPINLSYVLRAYVLHAFVKSNLEEILSFGGFLRCTSSSIILI